MGAAMAAAMRASPVAVAMNQPRPVAAQVIPIQQRTAVKKALTVLRRPAGKTGG